MFIKLDDSNASMKLVYQLSEELKQDPGQVAMTQALTLDESKPSMGLKGTHGLFGSDEWWNNIKSGVASTRFMSGLINRTYVTGQEQGADENTFDIVLGDSSRHTESFFANNESDYQLFKVGCRVEIIYVIEDLKGQSMQSDVVLEMAVSEAPV